VTGFELVAGVIGIFFAAGLVVGALIVTVISRRHGHRYVNGGDWHELPLPHDDEDGPPRWPGG
jgi:hypothetical protein